MAERMRPDTLDHYAGQEHLVGKQAILRQMIENDRLTSFILWGPPGVGKTTLIQIIAQQLQHPFFALSAINAGVKDVREVIDKAKHKTMFNTKSPILFIDEIHRFNKAQQDSLLAAVEKGEIILLGATTENPSFEVINPLLSRCQIFILKPLEVHDLQKLLDKALAEDKYLSALEVDVRETDALFQFSGGDARKLYNILDVLYATAVADNRLTITNRIVMEKLQNNMAQYDKNGEQHYDIISAFIKSIRGSDPNAAVYWLAKMINGGEDPKFIARRLLISAAEDIGLANPNALLLAQACFEAIQVIGMPEGRIILSEATVYLATSPKSNSTYMAINQAMDFIQNNPAYPVPLHLRNAPTKLMKSIGYGKNYDYSHSNPQHFAVQEYLPQEMSGTTFYTPADNAKEQEIAKHLQKLWGEKYNTK